MTRKIIAGLTSLLLTFTLASCGGSETAEGPSQENQELVEAPQQEVQASGGFDSEIKLPTGESYILSVS